MVRPSGRWHAIAAVVSLIYPALAGAHVAGGRPQGAVPVALQLTALDTRQGWPVLVEVARRAGPGACRLAAGGERFEPGCGVVERQSCPAYEDLVRLLVAAGEQTRAQMLVDRLRAEQRCPQVVLSTAER